MDHDDRPNAGSLNRRHVVLALVSGAALLAGVVRAQGGLIPREAIVDLTRAQSRVICTSEPFLSCMGFEADECLALSEASIEQCLMTLPAEIDPMQLENETLESCPQLVYADAGYTEEKAAGCFEDAIEAGS